MSRETLKIGFIPLVDAAPLIMAQEMGFAAQERLQLEFVRAPSWSALRDLLSFGQVDAAHMLSPVPVASALGLGGAGVSLSAVSVLSINGNVMGVSADLAARLRAQGYKFDFKDATAAGENLLKASGERLRVGVPFPFSMHMELLSYWLSALGTPGASKVDIRTVPPPLMASALKAGEIDAFCVGEPWGTKAVEAGFGELLLPTNRIWSFAPEKVLAVRSASLETAEADQIARLIRAVWKANQWLGDPASRALTTEMLSRSAFLDLPAEWIDRALSGRLVINGQGDERACPGFVRFFGNAATMPWPSQGEWIGRQIAQRLNLDPREAATKSAAVFRADLHRAALHGVSLDLPPAFAPAVTVGQALDRTDSADSRGAMVANAFFDGRLFDPNGGM